MSTTLTNGLKLPDKGSVDWYADMQNNYTILDGAVGTVAEHTTALSGKAPLVHTHVTADVTDLLNSNHTWSGENTYSKAVTIIRNTDQDFISLKNSGVELGSTPASGKSITTTFRDKNDDRLGYMGMYYDTDGSNLFRLYVRNKFTSGAPSTSGTADYAYIGLKLNADKTKESFLKASLRPYDNNTYDLGSSSYQWKTLNGINPGALSLPNIRSSTQMDLTSWSSRSVNGTIGGFTAPVDCIVSIQMTRDVDWGVWVISGNFRQSFRSVNNQGTHLIFLTFPVAKGESMGIYYPEIPSTENPITFVTDKQRYFPCLGNVS